MMKLNMWVLTRQIQHYKRIDFYIAGGTNGLSGDAEVQFFGKGWIICDSIESSNIASGYTATEISL